MYREEWKIRDGLFVLGVCLVVLGAGCAPKVQDEAQLQCERQGYPCYASDVPDEVALQTLRLAVASEMRRQRQPTDEIARWLRQQPNMVEVKTRGESIAFRLEGGQWGFSLLSAVPDGEQPMQALSRQLEPSEETARGELVAGDQHEDKREQKYALMWVPQAWEFGPNGGQTGAGVRSILEDTRGYRGNVTTLANQEADVASMKRWDEYDVVLVATHGGCFGVEQDLGNYYDIGFPCAPASLMTGELAAEPVSIAEGTTLEELENDVGFNELFERAHTYVSSLGPPGVHLAPSVDCGGVDLGCKLRLFVTVDTSHLERMYPDGIDKTFFWVGACSSMGGGQDADLAVTLLGEDSAMVGWTSLVGQRFTRIAAEEFFGWLKKGLNVTEALDLQQNNYDGNFRSTLVAKSTDFVRIREVVTALDPIVELEHGADASALLASESFTDDGRPDRLDLAAKIEGVTDGTEQFYKVQFKLDGKKIGPEVAPTAADKEGEFTYHLEIPNVDVGKDLKKDQMYTLTARVKVFGQDHYSYHKARDIIFSKWCEPFPYKPIFSEETGGSLETELEQACAPLNASMEPGHTYAICACGNRPLQPDGTILECDILCDEDGSGDCVSGDGVLPDGYQESSRCFKEAWKHLP